MGKHYTFVPTESGKKVRETKNRVLRRHYTIANCMQKDFYKSLINAVTKKDKFDNKLLDDSDCQSVHVAVKSYSLEKGVARRMFVD